MAQTFASERGGPLQAKARPGGVGAADRSLEGLQAAADRSPAVSQLASIGAMAGAPVQMMDDEEMLQGKLTEPVQRLEEEEMLQGKFAEPVQKMNAPAAGQGGLSPTLQASMEGLTGTDLSGVDVHYNSSKPADVGAHAFAQGSEIHIAPGQDAHLGHELAHVAQQRQGRVEPTIETGGVAINDDPSLEREADQLGAAAMQQVATGKGPA